MNILLTGAAGQLGSELLPLMRKHGRVFATDRRIPEGAGKDWAGLDMGDAGMLESQLNRLRPELIVNTAAYTAVDQAEADPETSFTMNADLPARLGHWCKRNDARLIHYSTDYVFNGEANVAYLESDAPDPKNVYGDSKLAGESAVADSGCKFVTLRTSWVYSSHCKNFVLSMLELARRGLALNIVNDQKGCPTWARNLASASDAVIQKWQAAESENMYGVFHYCDDRAVSWYEFARSIFRLAVDTGLLQKEPMLTPVPSSQFPQTARRPHWSVLNAQKISEVFRIEPASFQQSLRTVIGEISAGDEP